MPKVRKVAAPSNEEMEATFRKLNPNVELISITDIPKKKRGRPPGVKNKPKEESGFKYNPNANYRYWFVASGCGCRLGANILGAGMWCKHKNMMHLEDRDKK